MLYNDSDMWTQSLCGYIWQDFNVSHLVVTPLSIIIDRGDSPTCPLQICKMYIQPFSMFLVFIFDRMKPKFKL